MEVVIGAVTNAMKDVVMSHKSWDWFVSRLFETFKATLSCNIFKLIVFSFVFFWGEYQTRFSSRYFQRTIVRFSIWSSLCFFGSRIVEKLRLAKASWCFLGTEWSPYPYPTEVELPGKNLLRGSSMQLAQFPWPLTKNESKHSNFRPLVCYWRIHQHGDPIELIKSSQCWTVMSYT